MKSANANMVTFLNSSQTFLLADLYTFTLVDGTIARYTSCDMNISVGGSTYDSTGPVFVRGQTSTRIGVEVDELEVSVVPKSTDTIDGVAWLQAAQSGVLDGSTLLLTKLVTDDFANTARGVVTMFGGSITDIEVTRAEAKLSVKSNLELLNVVWPIDLFQPSCLNTVYDSKCGLDRESFAVTSNVAGGSTRTQINCNLAQAAEYFDLGKIVFTSGSMSGRQASIRSYTAGVLTLMTPLPETPAFGATFKAYPGCNKLLTGDCTTKFVNTGNFRGTPFTPIPETST